MLENFENAYEKADIERRGSIGYTEYSFFMSSFFEDNLPFPEDVMNYFFVGLDVEDKGEITHDQLYKLVEDLLSNNTIEINKYLFLAIDTDKDAKITKDSFLELASFHNITVKQSVLSKLPDLISFSQTMRTLFNIQTKDLEPAQTRIIEYTESDDLPPENFPPKKRIFPAILILGIAAACAGIICFKKLCSKPSQELYPQSIKRK